MDLGAWSFLGASFALLSVIVTTMALIGRRRERLSLDASQRALLEGRHLPATLHPVINPDLCIGSLSCIQACPEGDILGVLDGKGALVEGANCIGHGRCQLECPVNAISLVFGSSERGADLPQLDTNFETSRPGVHIVGELGGMGLIKNAMTQGVQCAEHLQRVLPAASDKGAVDAVIIGAGPAGIAVALGLRAKGRAFRLIDQGKLGGTVFNYPRQKVVMTAALDLPLIGKFGKGSMSKEQLMAGFLDVCHKAKITAEEGVRVTGIEGNDGAFVVQTSNGPMPARKVVLAIGRRGTPRKLGIIGETLPHVSYQLIEPEQYLGARVLVVGGGDSAMEAAMTLAEPGVAKSVTISYRGLTFAKCREANRSNMEKQVKEGRVRALMASDVLEIKANSARLRTSAGEIEEPFDYVFICAGGELPADFLKQSGVQLKRHFGDAHTEDAIRLQRHYIEKTHRPYLAIVLSLIGIGIIATLIAVGKGYYWLPAAERVRAPMHNFLKPSGLWGHGVGIVATLFMMTNFLYAARKRLRFWKGGGPIRTWLTFHMFVGIMSPIVIAFHAAFRSHNVLATSTFVSLAIVVGTGLIGRFVYSFLPIADGQMVPIAMLRGERERFRKNLVDLLMREGDVLKRLPLIKKHDNEEAGLISLLFNTPRRAMQRWIGERVLAKMTNRQVASEASVLWHNLRRVDVQVRFHAGLRRFFSSWRIFHVSLSILLVAFISLHIGVSLYLGYRWILK